MQKRYNGSKISMLKTVADIMTRNPITVTPDTPLTEVIRTIAEQKVSGLPVVDDAGKLVGVISETDLMWRETGVTPPPYIMLLDSVIYLENPGHYERELHKALGQTVKEAMSQKPVTVTPDKPLREAAQILHEHKIHRLPVLNPEGHVVGILTRGDIIRAMAAEQDG